MELLENIFLGMFLLGFLFTVISAVMSGAFGHAFGEGSAFDAHGTHVGQMGGDVGPSAAEGSPEVGWAQHELATFSPLSPTTISAFVTAAGGMGYLSLARWEWGPWASGLLALASGLVFAALLFGILYFVFAASQGSSVVHVASLVGVEAEVSLAIPSQGLGEVAYVQKGQRNTMQARCADAAAVPRGAKVVIKSVSPTVFVVEETRESWLSRSKAGGASAAR
jgi:hypothetical protein